MRTLPPQHLRPGDYADMEEQLRAAFVKILFAPLWDILVPINAQASDAVRKGEILNSAQSDLTRAMRSGRIQYADGVFSGEFNLATSRALRSVGAAFDSRSKVYRLSPGSVPAWIKAEAAGYQSLARGIHDSLRSKISEMQSHLDLSVGLLDLDATSTTKEIEEGWRKTVQQITVHPELSAEGKALLAKNYTTNMRLWIKTFSEQQIEDLREVVEQNAQQGYRFDRLIERIKQREGVSRSKAKFLARQETGLFMSQYRARRFEDVGVKRYIWSTSHDVRVRDGEGGHGNHKVLDGKVFFYATKAPAQFMSSKTPCNPGEDYNCRCVDRPLPPHAAAEESLHA